MPTIRRLGAARVSLEPQVLQRGGEQCTLCVRLRIKVAAIGGAIVEVVAGFAEVFAQEGQVAGRAVARCVRGVHQRHVVLSDARAASALRCSTRLASNVGPCNRSSTRICRCCTANRERRRSRRRSSDNDESVGRRGRTRPSLEPSFLQCVGEQCILRIRLGIEVSALSGAVIEFLPGFSEVFVQKGQIARGAVAGRVGRINQ